MTQRYQHRTPCPYCGKMIKPLQRQAHYRIECKDAPRDIRRESIQVSVKGKWRPRW